MPSRLVNGPRRVPRQERGERRVAALLDAAASVIADSGYDAATMCEIAERADACIGSLYQFFPNKESLTKALRARYCEELYSLWSALEQTDALPTNSLVCRLVSEVIAFLDDRPALLYLLKSRAEPHDTSIRDMLRERLSRILLLNAPFLPKSRAFLVSVVILQIMGAMNELYYEAPKQGKKPIVREFECILVSYLSAQFAEAKSVFSKSKKKSS